MSRGAVICVLAIGLPAAAGACGGEDEPAASTTTALEAPTTEAEAHSPVDDAPVGGAIEGQGSDGSAGERDDDPAAGQAERPRSIEDVITAVLTGAGEPATICDQIVTERFVRIAYGARQGCIAAQQPGALARSVEVEEVGKRGNRVSAVVVPTGGPYDGIDIEVELIADPASPGAWLLDSLLADVPAGP